jgi:hypothetical protein
VTPIPKGRELADPAAAGSQVGALADLQLDDVRKAGTEAAVAHATYETRDGLSLMLSGIQNAEQRYLSIRVAASSPAAQAQARDLNGRLAGWEFEIPGYRYDAVFRPLAALLKPLPVPAGASAPARRSQGAPTPLPFGPQAGSAGGQDQALPQQSR